MPGERQGFNDERQGCWRSCLSALALLCRAIVHPFIPALLPSSVPLLPFRLPPFHYCLSAFLPFCFVIRRLTFTPAATAPGRPSPRPAATPPQFPRPASSQSDNPPTTHSPFPPLFS